LGRRLGGLVALFIALAATACRAAPASPDTKPVKYPDNEQEWYVVTLQDAKCGYMYAHADRIGDEIHTRVLMKFEIARGPTKVGIESEQAYRETLDGRPLAFQFDMTMGKLPMKTVGRVRDGKLELTTEQMGAKHEKTYNFDPEILFPWGLVVEQRRRGLEPGQSYNVKSYEPSVKPDGPLEMTVRVHDRETIDVLGKPRRLYRITTTLNLPVAVETESWVDEDATPVITTFDMGVIQVKMYQATKEQALADDEAPELFLSTLVPVSRQVPASAASVTYRLRLPPDSKMRMPDLPDTGMQTFQRVSDHEATLTVRRIDWDRVRSAGADDRPPAALAPYLAASAVADSNDGKIKRLARRAARRAELPAEKADALRNFVTDYISEKGLDVGFATATEVAQTKSGDCTEHGVLLTAMARAAGLPARGVSGIVQVPPGPLSAADKSIFGYHMWTQVFIDGQWVDIDAAMRQTDCDPTHIALAIMPLRDEGMIDSVMSLLPLLGRLEMEVVEITE
jgi:hypothetical protein